MDKSRSIPKLMKISLCFSVLVSGSLAFSDKASAAELGGSFMTHGYNNPIQLDDLALTRVDPQTQIETDVSSLTPGQAYRISFTVSDYDGLDALSIEVGLIHDPVFNDSDGNDIDDDFEALKGITNDGDQFDLYYNTLSMDQDPLLWITEGSTTSWQLTKHNINSLAKGTLSYTFTFDFIVSKVARFGSGWTLNVRVMDDDGGVTNPTTAVDRLENLSVAWYGEILTELSNPLDWKSLDYSHPTGTQRVTLGYLSNGAYQRLIEADQQWSGLRQANTALGHQGDTISANLVDDVSLSPDQSFSIEVSETLSGEPMTEGNKIQLSALSRLISESELKTSELGVFQEFTLILRLSERFQNGLYEGNIRFGITNGLNE